MKRGPSNLRRSSLRPHRARACPFREAIPRAVAVVSLPALALHAGPGMSVPATATPPDASDPDLQGEVRDRMTDEPVESALVTLTPAPSLEGDAKRAVTAADGTFEIPSVAEGEYRVEVQHVAYRNVDETVSITGLGVVRMEVSMVPEPLRLEPVVTVASEWVHPTLRGFYERMQTGIGQYMDREDIEAMNPRRATDIFWRFPAVRVQPSARYPHRDELVMAGGCYPTVYVDGIRTPNAAVTLDDYVWPEIIEGVEVYRSSAAAPARFVGQTTCGVIAIWTRPPGTPEDDSGGASCCPVRETGSVSWQR